jgi:hypothetical protein
MRSVSRLLTSSFLKIPGGIHKQFPCLFHKSVGILDDELFKVHFTDSLPKSTQMHDAESSSGELPVAAEKCCVMPSTLFVSYPNAFYRSSQKVSASVFGYVFSEEAQFYSVPKRND